jgi:hypothetical protein
MDRNTSEFAKHWKTFTDLLKPKLKKQKWNDIVFWMTRKKILFVAFVAQIDIYYGCDAAIFLCVTWIFDVLADEMRKLGKTY